MSLDISIIIPVYNSGTLLHRLVDEIQTSFNKLQFEIIFIDDCSEDNSWSVIENLKYDRKDIRIQAIRLTKNFGQHNAILCGLRFSTAGYVITMDDDLEVLPVEMLGVYEKAKQDQLDLAYACYQKKYDSLLRNVLTNYFHFWAKITSGKKREKGSGYRVISQRMVNEIKNHQSEIFFIDEIITWYTSSVKYFQVQKNPHKLIKSRYSAGKLFNTSLGLILLSYLFPIRSVSIIGGLIALINFLIGIYFMYKKFLLKIPVEGYTSLIVSILFSTGIILLFIGVLAEYINKILRVSSKAPNYFIDKKV